MPLTVGSGQATLVQSGPFVVGVANPIVPTLPVASRKGTALLVHFVSLTQPITVAPSGFVRLATVSQASNLHMEAWLYPNNPGGILASSFTTASMDIGGFQVVMTEWAGVISSSALETSGTATATSGTTLAPAVSAAIVNSGDLIISAWCQLLAVNGTVTFTTPPGFTRATDNGSFNAGGHTDLEYQIGPIIGSIPSPTLTSSTATTTSAVGIIVALRGGTPVTDQTAYIRNDSMQWKLNTGDFVLVQGGRYMLEDGSGFYQLEDGSGDYILDTYVPQLGDPVAWTGDGTRGNPSWNGIVVNVNTHDLDDVLTNYRLVDVAATNATAAPGGSAPGDLSDVPTGGFYQLEDGSGDYLLEDGTGYYTLEGTSFGYRGLSVQKTQNQDGTITTYGQATVFEGGFAAGQSFNLTSQNQGYSAQPFTVTNVTNSWLDQLPVYLIEFGDPYQTLQKAGGGVLTQQASTAVVQQGAAVPAGTLGYAQVTASQTGITASVDLTGLTVTVTVSAGRRIRLSFFGLLQSTVSGDSGQIQAQEGATVLIAAIADIGTTPVNASVAGSVILQPTAGVHTYKLTAARAVGTGSLTMAAGANNPAWIMAEDIGV